LVITLLSGKKIKDMQNDPLFSSMSPSEFWGKRWNKPIQTCLKNGVYRPIRKFCPTIVAFYTTFLASGLLHEYVLYIFSLLVVNSVNENRKFISAQYGNQTCFFLWNATIIILEHTVNNARAFKTIIGSLPKKLVPFLVLMTVLPISHWFTDEYVRLQFFKHYSVAIPVLVLIE